MLSLARRIGEEIVIQIPYGTTIPPEGINVYVRITEIEHGKAKLSFEAPRSIIVDRFEVFEQKQKKEKSSV